jgi:hypothetical protein
MGLVPLVGSGPGTLLVLAGGFASPWAMAFAIEEKLSDTRAVTGS